MLWGVDEGTYGRLTSWLNLEQVCRMISKINGLLVISQALCPRIQRIGSVLYRPRKLVRHLEWDVLAEIRELVFFEKGEVPKSQRR